MMRVEDDVAFGCENLLLPRRRPLHAGRRLKAMGCGKSGTGNVQAFRGQKQRLAISSVYAMDPDLPLR